MNFNHEELMLMMLYNTGTRMGLVHELRLMQCYLCLLYTSVTRFSKIPWAVGLIYSTAACRPVAPMAPACLLYTSKMGHELLSRDELAVLDGGKCILQLRGVRPFLSDKYDLTQHPNYKLTSDYDPKNTFDIEKYLNRKEKINPNDEFVVIDADSLPSA